MHDSLWHLDEAFLSLVEKPILIIGTVFAAFVAAAVVITVRSLRDKNDS